MHGLFAYSGPDDRAATRWRDALTARGWEGLASTARGATTIGVFGAGSTARLVNDSAGPRAFYGSVAARCSSRASTLLDGDPEDVVAVAIDDSTSTLVVAAGRGSHRVFVHHDGDGGTWVSSSLDALRCSIAGLVLDRSYEDFLLGFGFVPEPHSMYRNVAVVKAGTRVAAGTTYDVKAVSHPANAATNRDDIIDALHDVLVGTIREQAGEHRRHAVLLGGFDSALVASILVSLGHEVETYTFRFANSKYVQRNVETVTAHLGVRHHWVDIDSTVIADNLRRFAEVFTQPGPQPHYQIHTLHAARRIAADGHTHIFTGDGCDAIFLGYPTVSRRAAISTAVKRAPRSITRLAIGALSIGVVERRLGHVARMGRGTLRNRLLPDTVGAHLPTQVIDSIALRRLRRPPLPAQAEDVVAIRTRLAAGLHRLNKTQLAFNGNGMNGQSKVKVDGAVAATGVPQASPFLHSRLRTFVSGIPFEFIRSEGSSAASAGKEVLIDMVRRHGLLPDAIIDQPKQSPSDSPVDEWYMHDLRGEVVSQLNDLPFETNRPYVNDLLAPKVAESWYRNKVSISHHTLQAVGLLLSYASFNRGVSTDQP